MPLLAVKFHQISKICVIVTFAAFVDFADFGYVFILIQVNWIILIMYKYRCKWIVPCRALIYATVALPCVLGVAVLKQLSCTLGMYDCVT